MKSLKSELDSVRMLSRAEARKAHWLLLHGRGRQLSKYLAQNCAFPASAGLVRGPAQGRRHEHPRQKQPRERTKDAGLAPPEGEGE